MKSTDPALADRAATAAAPVSSHAAGARVRQFVRFLVFGAINTGVTYVIYVICLFVVPYQIAYTASYAAGIGLSYFLNARFVFGEPLRLSSAVRYPLVYATQYLLGLGVLYLAVEVIGVSEYLAPVVVICLTMPVTFVLSRYIITGRPRPVQQ